MNYAELARQADTWVQDDGAVWKVAEIDGGHVVVTSSGQELLADRPGILGYVEAYQRRVMGAAALAGDPETRTFVASGARSDVYDLAPGIVVKEAELTGSSIYAMARMDRLFNVIETSVPRWIDMPHQYGIVSSSRLPREYIAQQKIDSGVTVEWLLEQDDLNDLQRTAVEREFGDVAEEEQDMIREAYVSAGEIVAEALERIGEDPKSYLPDYHEGNVLVKRLRTPIAGQTHKLWLIDQ